VFFSQTVIGRFRYVIAPHMPLHTCTVPSSFIHGSLKAWNYCRLRPVDQFTHPSAGADSLDVGARGALSVPSAPSLMHACPVYVPDYRHPSYSCGERLVKPACCAHLGRSGVAISAAGTHHEVAKISGFFPSLFYCNSFSCCDWSKWLAQTSFELLHYFLSWH
jgi:hypothetical protein